MAHTVVLDFDGVIHSYVSGWNGPVPTDPPSKGALAFVGWLLSTGYTPVICTTRALTPEGLQGTQQWLVKYNFPTLTVTAEKVPGIAYVDDRAVVCRPTVKGGPGFRAARTKIQKLAAK